MTRPSLVTVEISSDRCNTVTSATGSRFPDHDVCEHARLHDADFAGETEERGVATGVGGDRLERRHADLVDKQLGLLAVPAAVLEGRGVSGVAAAQDRDPALARVADHLKALVELGVQPLGRRVAAAAADAVRDADPG
jgi:hypothetical protein